MTETWEKKKAHFGWQVVEPCGKPSEEGTQVINVIADCRHEHDADQIIADHNAARVLADAVEALREIRDAFIEDAAADSNAEILAAGKRIDAAVMGVNGFFAAHPEHQETR